MPVRGSKLQHYRPCTDSVQTLTRFVLPMQSKATGLTTLDSNVEHKGRTGKRRRGVAACTEGESMKENVVPDKEVKSPLLLEQKVDVLHGYVHVCIFASLTTDHIHIH